MVLFYQFSLGFVKFFPLGYEKSEPAKRHFILSLFNGHIHWKLNFITNMNISQNKKTYEQKVPISIAIFNLGAPGLIFQVKKFYINNIKW